MKTPQLLFEELAYMRQGAYILQVTEKGRILSSEAHSHDFFESVLVLSGEVVQTVNEVPHLMRKGDVSILSPGDVHSFAAQSPDVRVLLLSVSPRELYAVMQVPCSLCGETAHAFSLADGTAQMEEMYVACRRRAGRAGDLRLLLAAILNQYAIACDKEQDGIPASLREAVSRLAEDAVIAGGMEAFASLAGYSYPHLYRLTRRYYGKTPHELLQEAKLRRAYEEVIFGEDPIERIGEACGYGSAAHFRACFRARYGLSPSALRKKSRRMQSI